MRGWTTTRGIFASESTSEFYPYRSESASIANQIKVLLRYDPKDTTNECTFDSHRGFNVRKFMH